MYNSQEAETTQVSNDGLEDEQNVVCPQVEYYAPLKRNGLIMYVTWTSPEVMMLRASNQTPKEGCYVTALT